MQRLRWRGGVGGAGAVGAVAGVDSHLLQLNLACLRGSTLCTDIPSSAQLSLTPSLSPCSSACSRPEPQLESQFAVPRCVGRAHLAT